MTFLILSIALLTPLPMYLQRPARKSAISLRGKGTKYSACCSRALMKYCMQNKDWLEPRPWDTGSGRLNTQKAEFFSRVLIRKYSGMIGLLKIVHASYKPYREFHKKVMGSRGPCLAPPSRSSLASLAPVEAPLGTAPRKQPFSVETSASTVGFPRESNICLYKVP